MVITALIERNGNGFHTVISEDKVDGCYIAGYGDTVEEAKNDFIIGIAEIHETLKGQGKTPTFSPEEVNVSFRYTISVYVGWTPSNLCAGWSYPGLGMIVVTNKTLDGLKQDFAETLDFSLEGWKTDGYEIPQWLEAGEYELKFELDAAAQLQA